MMSLIFPNKKRYPNMIFLIIKFTKHNLLFGFLEANIDGEQKFVH